MKHLNFIVVTIVAVLLSSCACESKGKKEKEKTPEERITIIAQQMVDLHIEHNQAILAAYQEFVDNFNTNIYETRINAQNILNAKIQEINNNFDVRKTEIDQRKIALLVELGYEKYVDILNIGINTSLNSDTSINIAPHTIILKSEPDYIKYETLINIYNNTIIEKCEPIQSEEVKKEELAEKCAEKINTIKPSEPGVEMMLNDLKGYSFREADSTENYFRHCVKWTIEADDELTINITNVDDYGKVREYDVRIFWRRYETGGAYHIDARIGYVLKEEWEQQFFKCNKILPHKTNRYDNFISKKWSGITGKHFYIRNNSDLTLVVCGQVLNKTCVGYWEKFYMILEENQSRQASAFNIDEYQIDYIERY